jgi:hypothetical protein
MTEGKPGCRREFDMQGGGGRDARDRSGQGDEGLAEVTDMDEAVAWVKRCPNPMPGPSEIEIRPLYEMADFGEALTPEVAQLHEGVRERIGR